MPTPEPAVDMDPTHDAMWAGFTESVVRWRPIVEYWSGQYSMDPWLVAAVMTQESGGDPHAVSRAGAVGLLQVMPRDNRVRPDLSLDGRPSHGELLDPATNVSAGVHILAVAIQHHHGAIRDALAEYNAGRRGASMGRGYGYADKVMNIYARALSAAYEETGG